MEIVQADVIVGARKFRLLSVKNVALCYIRAMDNV